MYKASYDLLLEIFQFTKIFTQEYKYTVGESLKNETLELITLIYRANSKTDQRDTLQTAREKIEVIRLFVRLMKDLKQIRYLKKPLFMTVTAAESAKAHITESGGWIILSDPVHKITAGIAIY